MLRSQRSDLFMLLLCAVPVIVALLLFLNYQNTGQLPFALPWIDFSQIDTSRIPTPASLLPGGSDGLTRTVKDHPVLVVTGSVVGVLAFIMLAGIWTDFMVARRQRLSAETAREGEDALDAPWLGADEA